MESYRVAGVVELPAGPTDSEEQQGVGWIGMKVWKVGVIIDIKCWTDMVEPTIHIQSTTNNEFFGRIICDGDVEWTNGWNKDNLFKNLF